VLQLGWICVGDADGSPVEDDGTPTALRAAKALVQSTVRIARAVVVAMMSASVPSATRFPSDIRSSRSHRRAACI
jgi:hypothetical protein